MLEGIIISNEFLGEKCAVFGVYGVKEAARTAYYGLWALQHRGQESSGIVSSDGKKLRCHKAPGLVANVYREQDLDITNSSNVSHFSFFSSLVFTIKMNINAIYSQSFFQALVF